MDKITFLNELEYQLHKLPQDKIDEVMTKYENHFYQEAQKGHSDKAIVAALDSPKQIAKRKYAKYALNDAERRPNIPHMMRAVVATVGVSIITLCFILIPLTIVLIVMAAATFVSLGMILAPLILFIWNMWAGIQNFSLSNYLFSFAYLGLGTMFLVIIIKLLIAIRHLLIRYMKWNVNFIKKGTM
ncbi:DUF1700 domain-containing protein [Staphylococcus americanisciuri]|uniref:DUF1700 domain-containing protein n=1 Tax=Staphylococcus americanisciuri TaxID=2973940 RepID=A0ABT2F3G7_9STAP|nr:DUF1700 domain-containing protein [Staphylococcus americanisciuri]MCS4486932.1 DUF1700 domain-containing protein [Staphylococcus americanisciuri]